MMGWYSDPLSHINWRKALKASKLSSNRSPLLHQLFERGVRGTRLSPRAATLAVLRDRSHEQGVRRKKEKKLTRVIISLGNVEIADLNTIQSLHYPKARKKITEETSSPLSALHHTVLTTKRIPSTWEASCTKADGASLYRQLQHQLRRWLQCPLQHRHSFNTTLKASFSTCLASAPALQDLRFSTCFSSSLCICASYANPNSSTSRTNPYSTGKDLLQIFKKKCA